MVTARDAQKQLDKLTGGVTHNPLVVPLLAWICPTHLVLFSCVS